MSLQLRSTSTEMLLESASDFATKKLTTIAERKAQRKQVGQLNDLMIVYLHKVLILHRVGRFLPEILEE